MANWPLQAPFPWFGGKSTIADVVWNYFGDVSNYVEPFFGSGAVLLNRPLPFDGLETVNDKDGFVANFWRAIQRDPEAVANWANSPVNENDLHARHSYLVNLKDSFCARLDGDPDYYDVKIAGWWVWGICCWIGGGWCSGKGPWHVVEGQLVHLGDAGQGVKRQLVHLGDAGQGVKRKRVHLGDAGQGETASEMPLLDWFFAIANRLFRVRVCSGDWSRVCGPTPTVKQGLTAVFLDPPYADTASRTDNLYREDSNSVAHAVREWAIANGDDPRMRIALCGYAGEHLMPKSWTEHIWKARGGYGSQAKDGTNNNADRERIWFSPHCLTQIDVQPSLFEPKLDGVSL